MKKIVGVVGKGWTKWKINLNATSLFYQMKLVSLSLKYFYDDKFLAEIIECLQKIDEFTSEEQKRNVKLNSEKI